MGAKDPRIDAVLDRLNTGAKVRRFFDKADDPVWLEPARERRLFKRPPDAILDGNSLRFVGWPQAEFLARVAGRSDPKSVVAAVRDVPSTDNVIIYPNLLKALLAIAPASAAEVTEQVDGWIRVPFAGRFIFGEVAELVGRLAAGGLQEQAFRLATSMLAVVGPRPDRDVDVEGTTVRLRQEPETLLEPWEFNRFLEAAMPSLIERYPMATTVMLGGILDGFLLAEFGEKAREAKRDISYVWCREVEKAAERPVPEYKQALVPWLRDAALASSHLGHEATHETVRILRAYGWPIHARVALLVAETLADTSPDLARELLLDHALFAGLEHRHEYSRLAQRAFSQLEDAEKDQVLGWVDDGPAFDATAEQMERWRRDRLTPMREALPSSWRERYASLVTKFGEPDWQADHVTGPTEHWIGPTSPLNTNELRQMSVAQVIEYLRSWQPSSEWRAASREGLGRLVTADVSARPDEYAAAAESFAELDPIYARSFISGQRASADKLRGADLAPTLELATRIAEGRVAQPKRGPRSVFDADDDPDWKYSRLELAHLMEALSRGDLLDEAQDSIVWHCLSILLEDADPTASDEATYGVGMGAVNYSINTVRGQAIHATASFLGHLHRTQRLQGQLAMDIKTALLRRLDPEHEVSAAVRAAIGTHYPQLVASDIDERGSLAAKVFTDDSGGREAWAALLRFNQLGRQSVDVLWPVLHRALNDPEWQKDEDSLTASLRLVIALNIWGYQARDDLMGELVTGWAASSVKARASVLFTLGDNLTQASAIDGSATKVAAIVDALLTFEEQHRDEKVEKRSDLEALGWVLSNDRLPIEWTINSLQRLLGLGSLPMDPEDVISRLAGAMVNDNLQERVVACLFAIEHLDIQNWAIYAARQPIAEIFRLTRESSNRAVRERGQELQGKLLAAGRFNPDWLKHPPVDLRPD